MMNTTMRYVALCAFLSACSIEIEPVHDADRVVSDAGIATNPDSGFDPWLDADVEELDAGSDGGSDGGVVVVVDPDAAEPGSDAGSDAGRGPDAPDAGSDASSDAGPPVDCAADPFEPNDTLETALIVASSSSGLAETVDLTWHAGDAYDWIAFEVASPGFPGAIQVRAIDRLPGGAPGSTADMRVSVRCVGSELVWCHGGAVASRDRLNPCERAWNPNISSTEMACSIANPTLEIRVGMRRRSDPWVTRCDHAAEVTVRPAGS